MTEIERNKLAVHEKEKGNEVGIKKLLTFNAPKKIKQQPVDEIHK